MSWDNIIKEAYAGNYSFAILIVGIMQTILMIVALIVNNNNRRR